MLCKPMGLLEVVVLGISGIQKSDLHSTNKIKELIMCGPKYSEYKYFTNIRILCSFVN